jgi:hypothetical protein
MRTILFTTSSQKCPPGREPSKSSNDIQDGTESVAGRIELPHRETVDAGESSRSRLAYLAPSTDAKLWRVSLGVEKLPPEILMEISKNAQPGSGQTAITLPPR